MNDKFRNLSQLCIGVACGNGGLYIPDACLCRNFISKRSAHRSAVGEDSFSVCCSGSGRCRFLSVSPVFDGESFGPDIVSRGHGDRNQAFYIVTVCVVAFYGSIVVILVVNGETCRVAVFLTDTFWLLSAQVHPSGSVRAEGENPVPQ